MTVAIARGVFIAGTDTGAGKTRVTVALLRQLCAQGVRAAGMKPVATGTITTDRGQMNEDVAAITACCGLDTAEPELVVACNPYCFEWPVAPHIAARRCGVVIETLRVAAAYQWLAGRFDAVVVEGTGGWLSPIGPQQTMADVAAALKLPVVLVVGLRLGCLNHALLSAQAIAVSGLPLVGWIGSLIDRDMAALKENIEWLDARLPAPRLALLPFSATPDEDLPRVAGAAARLFAPLVGTALATVDAAADAAVNASPREHGPTRTRPNLSR